jgi:hypothetical protein
MRRTLIALALAAPFVCGTAVAQERTGAGRFEIGAFPVGGVFFTESASNVEPAFGNFALGATVTYTVNRWIGIEGEVGNAIGIRQHLNWQNGVVTDTQSPCLYAYSGNLTVHPLTGNTIVPYATVGAGGMTLLDTDDTTRLNLGGHSTYFVGNTGGGIKWYAHSRWGLRGDYRLLMVKDKGEAPAFFGGESVRFGHRVYGGLLFFF